MSIRRLQRPLDEGMEGAITGRLKEIVVAWHAVNHPKVIPTLLARRDKIPSE